MTTAVPDPGADDQRPPDWKTRVALVWAVVFAILYGRMVIRLRIPTLAVWLDW